LERIAQGSPSEPEDYCYAYFAKSPSRNISVETDVSEPRGTQQRHRIPDLTDIDATQSILSQRKDPDRYPEITYLGKVFSQIYFFRSPNFGHRSPLRGPQPADLPTSFLMENGANLGMVLNDLLNRPATRRLVLENLRRFYDSVEDVTTKVHSGVVETLFHERGLREPIPATRLSDGTLRFLSLLTILCHPMPPPLVCIEDPELGLHPDVLPLVAELMLDASQRTQLIVTTHSDILVSALSSVPECIVVCEKDDCGTQLRRLESGVLREWLEKYSLGELWRMGETGGNP
jgi:predicted ATPase